MLLTGTRIAATKVIRDFLVCLLLKTLCFNAEEQVRSLFRELRFHMLVTKKKKENDQTQNISVSQEGEKLWTNVIFLQSVWWG